MTSVMAFDGVTSLLGVKDVTNTCKRIRHCPTIGGISSMHWRKDCCKCVLMNRKQHSAEVQNKTRHISYALAEIY